MEESLGMELIVGTAILAAIIGIWIWGVFMFFMYLLFFTAIALIVCAAIFFIILGICYIHEKKWISKYFSKS
jgi:hypothetical protein